MFARVRWGPVLMGAVTGLFVMVLASLAVFGVTLLFDFKSSDNFQYLVLALALFFGQLAAGYAGGRLTSADSPAFHGSQSGLALFAIITVLTLTAGSPVGGFTLVLFALVSLLIGYAGGVLGGRPRGEEE